MNKILYMAAFSLENKHFKKHLRLKKTKRSETLKKHKISYMLHFNGVDFFVANQEKATLFKNFSIDNTAAIQEVKEKFGISDKSFDKYPLEFIEFHKIKDLLTKSEAKGYINFGLFLYSESISHNNYTIYPCAFVIKNIVIVVLSTDSNGRLREEEQEQIRKDIRQKFTDFLAEYIFNNTHTKNTDENFNDIPGVNFKTLIFDDENTSSKNNDYDFDKEEATFSDCAPKAIIEKIFLEAVGLFILSFLADLSKKKNFIKYIKDDAFLNNILTPTSEPLMEFLKKIKNANSFKNLEDRKKTYEKNMKYIIKLIYLFKNH